MKKLRVKVLERVIKHTIHGEKERAARLMEKLMAAVGSQIVNEANYGNEDDPMFPARRELQRELEDDIAQDRVEDEPTELGDDLPADGGELEGEPCDDDGECTPDAVAQMIADLVKAGGVDEDKLSQIVDILVGDEGGDEGGLEGDNLDADAVPGEGEPTDEFQPEGGETGAIDMDNDKPEDATLKL